MKRFFAFVLVLLFSFAIMSCGKKEVKEEMKQEVQEQVQEEAVDTTAVDTTVME